MANLVIPSANWTEHLIRAIEVFEVGDIIVVDSENKKQLAMRAAERLGKTIEVTDLGWG